MKTKILLSITFLFILLGNLPSFAEEREKNTPLSILIIGGGPAGLATAIEAKAHGCIATVVEKRESYSRSQWLFLLDPSLKLLEKWSVSTPQMRVADLGDGECLGIVRIKHLEEQLEKRAQELEVKKIFGEFQGFGSDQTAVIVTPEKNERLIPYDIIVGADGSHSRVREALGIEKNCLGTAVGAFALISDPTDPSTDIDISPPIKEKDVFLRRIKVPSTSILFIQAPLSASKTKLQEALTAQGWIKEAKAVEENKAFVATDIDIFLQQAQTFSNEQKSAVLVGDAAASASFFQGLGANTALKTAEIGGHFFKEIQTHNQTAFQNFNQAMKETTDALIEDSAFLFGLDHSN